MIMGIFQWGLAASKFIIIAHRGASGYLPEHTLVAKALAYGQGADYLEQDVVLTKDDVPIVLHDIHLDTVSDVAQKFPEKKREDGRYYAIDFTLEEIQSLNITERFDHVTGAPVYLGRFPKDVSKFKIPSLEEEILFIRGLNRSSGRSVGIYPEIKSPKWHLDQGKDISSIVLKVLEKHGYVNELSPVYLQCFDFDEIKRIREELGCKLRMVQLIGENSWKVSETDYEYLQSNKGLNDLKKYVDGIGPWIPQVMEGDLAKRARTKGLVIHPYTFRVDDLPVGQKPQKLFNKLVKFHRVDGLFTDFPDKVKNYLNR